MRVHFTQTADQQLKRLSHGLQTRIVEKVEFYSLQPDPLKFAEPITGSDEYRFRIGDHRAIFEVLYDTIWVTAVKRRDEAYR